MARDGIQKRVGSSGQPSYRVRVELPPDPVSGKRRQASESFRTRREAERRLSSWRVEIERGTAVLASTMTVADLLEQWLTTVAAHSVRETTLKGYRDTCRLHIVPAIGNIPVQRLTAARVQAFYAERLDAGVGPRTVQLCHLRLSQALRQAVRWQIVPASVCDHVSPPTVRSKRGGTWDREQLGRFLAEAAGDALAPLWDLLATTGMRRGEALGLRWRDVDLERGVATVNQSVVLFKGAPLIQEPKTIAGRRTVGLLPGTVDALKAHRKVWLARKLASPPELWQDLDLIVCTAVGSAINPSNCQRNFERILAAVNTRLKAAELPLQPRIRIHDLRHTHATLLLGAGTPVHVVSRRLGHAKTSITHDIYVHTLAGQDEAAVTAFDQLLKLVPKRVDGEATS